MKITANMLLENGVCFAQVKAVAALWRDGADPTIEALTEAATEGLDPWWLWRLLPLEGPGSQRAYALWCAEQVSRLSDDSRVTRCLATVRRRVEDPSSVSDRELMEAIAEAAEAAWAARAAEAAWAAGAAEAAWAAGAAEAAWAAGAAGAAEAAWAARAAFDEASLACLSDLLLSQDGAQ